MVDDDPKYLRNIKWSTQYYQQYASDSKLDDGIWGDNEYTRAKLHEYFQTVADIQKKTVETTTH